MARRTPSPFPVMALSFDQSVVSKRRSAIVVFVIGYLLSDRAQFLERIGRWGMSIGSLGRPGSVPILKPQPPYSLLACETALIDDVLTWMAVRSAQLRHPNEWTLQESLELAQRETCVPMSK